MLCCTYNTLRKCIRRGIRSGDAYSIRYSLAPTETRDSANNRCVRNAQTRRLHIIIIIMLYSNDIRYNLCVRVLRNNNSNTVN